MSTVPLPVYSLMLEVVREKENIAILNEEVESGIGPLQWTLTYSKWNQSKRMSFNSTFFRQVIMATNRQDTLDPALLRPGRLDRKIEFPLPDRRQKRLIFSTITGKMNLSEEVR